jgi:hypothetical protein
MSRMCAREVGSPTRDGDAMECADRIEATGVPPAPVAGEERDNVCRRTREGE